MYIERKTTVEKHQNSGAAFFMERFFGRFDQSIACFYGTYGTEIIFLAKNDQITTGCYMIFCGLGLSDVIHCQVLMWFQDPSAIFFPSSWLQVSRWVAC